MALWKKIPPVEVYVNIHKLLFSYCTQLENCIDFINKNEQ